MSKVINEPIVVHIVNNMPTAFIWRRRHYKVMEIMSTWWEPARWWNGEDAHLLVRLLAVNRTSTGIYELARNDAKWLLRRVLD